MSSEAFVVRDKIVTRLQALPFFANFNVFTNTAETIQPQNVPALSVYFVNEDMTPDGDANVGETAFRCSALYGVSIIIQDNNPNAAQTMLDRAWKEFAKLFIDPTLYNWKNAVKAWQDGSEVLVQAFTRGNRSHVFGAVGKENTIPIAELRFNLTCDLGVIDYAPVIDDDFETIHVETRYPSGDVDPAEVQQVVVQYDIPQN